MISLAGTEHQNRPVTFANSVSRRCWQKIQPIFQKTNAIDFLRYSHHLILVGQDSRILGIPNQLVESPLDCQAGYLEEVSDLALNIVAEKIREK